MNRTIILTLVACLACTVVRAEDSIKKISSIYVSTPPKIDGILNDSCWQHSSMATDFVLSVPNTGKQAGQQTECSVVYDKKNLYLGIKCYESLPSEIIATSTKKDVGVDEDHITIMFDTYHDHRSGYYFDINEFGNQCDGKILNNGWTADPRWDANWECVTSKDSVGWYAEIAIPFSELSFRNDSNITWGLKIYRYEKPHQERSFWPYPTEVRYMTSSFGHITGIQGIEKYKVLSILPYISQFIENVNVDNDSTTVVHKKAIARGGFDIQYSILKNMRINATVNPDFAQIEADQQRFNLSYKQGEELFLTEKRQFFLEGLAIFNTPMQIFYTRRMNDIGWGGKVNGKIGPISIGLLDVQTKDNKANYSAGRLKWDLFNKTNLGVLFASKYDTAGFISRLYSLDIAAPFYNNIVQGQVVGSQNKNYDKNSNWAGLLTFNHNADPWSYGCRYEDYGKNFDANSTGLISRSYTDCFSGNIWCDRTIWINNGIKNMLLQTYVSRKEEHNGRLKQVKRDVGLDVTLMNNFFFEVFHAETGEEQELKWYENRDESIVINSDNYGKISFSMSAGWGWLYDQNYRSQSFTINMQPFDRFNSSFELANLAIGQNHDWIFTVKTDHKITNNIFWRTNMQFNTADQTDQYNVLFGYSYLPGSIVYIGYNEKYNNLSSTKIVDRVLMAKVTYLWGI